MEDDQFDSALEAIPIGSAQEASLDALQVIEGANAARIETQLNQARSLLAQAQQHAAAGQPNEAAESARQGIALFLQLAPELTDALVFEVVLRVGIASGYLPPTKAVEAALQAVRLGQQVVEHNPGNTDYQFRLAWILAVLAQRHQAAGDLPAAQQPARQAIALFLQLAPELTDELVYDVVSRVGIVSGYLPPAEAPEAVRQAVMLAQQLVAANPTNIDYQFRLAWILVVHAQRLHAAGNLPAVAAPARQGIELFLRLAPQLTDELVYDVVSRVGIVSGYLPPAEGAEFVRRAVTLAEQLVERNPANTAYRERHTWSLRVLAQRLHAAGQTEAAAAVQQESVVRTSLHDLGYSRIMEGKWLSLVDSLKAYATIWGVPFGGGLPLADQISAVSRHLDERFCAVPDDLVEGEAGLHLSAWGEAFEHWSRGNLSYSIGDPGPSLAGVDVRGVLRKAFTAWEQVRPPGFFAFHEVPSEGNIKIHFGDDKLESVFGKPGGASGIANFPEDGNIGFDTAENWNTNRFYSVALHEIGHALGLRHSSNGQSLMFPKGSPDRIDRESQKALASIYGWTPQVRTAFLTADRPALAVAGDPTFVGGPTGDRLHMAWRGAGNDRSLYWSKFDGQNWGPHHHILGVGSTRGPALARVRSTGAETILFMAWRGAEGDSRIYRAYLADELIQIPVHGAHSDHGPTVAAFSSGLVGPSHLVYMAWTGEDGDQGIYWSTFDRGTETWKPHEKIRGVGTAHRPHLLAFQNRLYLFWRGINDSGPFATFAEDVQLYYTWRDLEEPAIWQPQRPILFASSEVGGSKWVPIISSLGPTATVRGDEIVLIWRGVGDDNGIYFAPFVDGEWFGQVAIPARGTFTGPSIALWDDRLFTAWRGVGDDDSIYYSYL